MARVRNTFWKKQIDKLVQSENIPVVFKQYLNFNTIGGETGYGFRDEAGVIQFKNSGGSWTNIGSGSGGGHVIEDEGTPLTQQTNLNFVGAGVTVTDAGGKTVVTIPGGSAGSGDMILASAQTNSGLKTFLDATLGLRNVANTFTALFTNAITAARTYTWPDASGTVALTSDLHSAVTVTDSTSIDLTLTGQDITAQREALTGAITALKNSNTTALGSFTKAQLDTAVTDGNILYVGDVVKYYTTVGDSTTDFPVANYTDVGAAVNAAYASLPSSGGGIFLQNGTYVFTTPIVFGTNGKIASLKGSNAASVYLQYTPASGNAITVNHGATSGLHRIHEITGITLMGKTTFTYSTDVNTRTSVGIFAGGTNGCPGLHIHDLTINGFGTQLRTGANCYMFTATNCALSGGNGVNGTSTGLTGSLVHINSYSNSGERMFFRDCLFTDPCNSEADNAIYVESSGASSLMFDGCSIDNSQIRVIGSTMTTIINCHFENAYYTAYGEYIPCYFDTYASGTLVFKNNQIVDGSTDVAKNFTNIVKHGVNLIAVGNHLSNYGGQTIARIFDNTLTAGNSAEYITGTIVEGGAVTEISQNWAYSQARGIGTHQNLNNSSPTGLVANSDSSVDWKVGANLNALKATGTGNLTALNKLGVGVAPTYELNVYGTSALTKFQLEGSQGVRQVLVRGTDAFTAFVQYVTAGQVYEWLFGIANSSANFVIRYWNGTTDEDVLTFPQAGNIVSTRDIAVPDEGYNATTWSGSLEVPTKNAVRDKVVTMDTAIALNTAKVTNATHTGEVTGSGALTITANAVTNAKLAQMLTKTYKGRTNAVTGDPEDVAVATLKTDLVLVKADVGLGSVDNTSDANKPVSTAQQTALNLKANLASPTFTGTVTVPTPTNATDAVNKSYADAITQSLDIKQSVRVASTVDIAVATALTNLSVIDGVTVATGDRVLLKNQTLPAENGIYTVVATGAAPRAIDADVSADVTSGMYVFVSEGTASADMGYVLTTNDPITLGTTGLVFTQFSGAGQITVDSTLIKTGNQLKRAPITGDIAIPDASNVSTLATVNANVGSFGLAGSVAQFTANAKGLITAVANVAISITSSAVTDFAATVRATTLTGLSLVSVTVISATDTVLVALGSLQAQITALTTTVTGKANSSTTITTTAPLSGGGDLSANRTLTTSMATNRLIGRGTAATGVMEEITPGAGIALSATTLNVTHVANAQVGVMYTYVTGDREKYVTHSNALAIAGTLPQAGASFPDGWTAYVHNLGAGALTITPTTSTINGNLTLVLTTGQSAMIVSDGTNYRAFLGASSGGGSGTVTNVSSANADATVTNPTTTPAITIVQTPALRSATTTVNVAAATAPTVGQVLTATSGTAATWQTPASGGGDMVLATAQTNSGVKTFLDTTMALRNVANTFSAVFTNAITAARTYTLKDASGTIAFTSDITGTNSGTNTGDQPSIVGITGTTAQFNTALTDNDFATLAGTETLTNKRNTKRTVVTAQVAAPAINTDNTDVATITGLAQAITSMTTNLTGTPNADDMLMINITDNGVARAITWGASFASAGATLPTTTVISTLLKVGFIRVGSVWNCYAVSNGDAMALKADLASPAFTGVPLAPTAAAGTNTTQIASTAFVTAVNNNASYGNILEVNASHIAGRVAGTYALASGNAAAVTGVGTLYPIASIHIVGADFPTINGITTKLRLRTQLYTNDVAPTGNFTFGLYPITRPATSGGAGVNIFALGTVVTGSNGATYTAPAADLLGGAVGADFVIPADGHYVIGVVTTATVAVSSHVHLHAQLQMRNA